jgi:hypothetical protein
MSRKIANKSPKRFLERPWTALPLFGAAVGLFLTVGTRPAARAAVAHGCTVEESNFDGWKSEQLANQWVKLQIVPQLAGRLMQVTFGDHDFLFVNDQLKGQYFPPDTAQHRWYNYGGDKIWPMPEGSQDEQHWAGAGGEPLDDAPYELQVLSKGPTCSVRLTGPVDPAIGQQYIRDISIGSDSPVISFHAVMKNVSGYPQSWSEQSVSQYNAASPSDATQFNPDFWGITPANPEDQHQVDYSEKGYHIRSGGGGPNSSPYSVSNGLFHLHWINVGGEVWVDSPGGWVAVVDGTTNYTMVERMKYDAAANYPDKATVIFFTTGARNRNFPPAAQAAAPAAAGAQAGQPAAQTANQPTNQIAPAGTPASGGTQPRAPIYYMEAEVNSPIVQLAPGESYAMDTQWYPTRMGDEFQNTTYSGAVGEPLAAAATPNGLVLTGNFGVFYAGQLQARFFNRGGESIGSAQVGDATPLQPVKLQTTVQAPPETARVSLHVIDAQGLDRGPLGEAFVNPPPPAPQGRGGGDGQ